MLTLPIKKKWFDMILSGEKKEEYREIKPYYKIRFRNVLRFEENSILEKLLFKNFSCAEQKAVFSVLFRNGYRKDSPSFTAKCTLSVGEGKTEWGAEPRKKYFVLTIHRIEYEMGGDGKCT